jgi:serine/threonine protein kinase
MIGQTISHYKILEKLGEGGMGIVYKAEDTKLKRTVALKFLPKGLEAHEPERARFLQEAQAASALNHPNICTIHDLQDLEGQQFIVMEFVDGVTLRNKIVGSRNASPLQVNDSISYAIQIGEALQEAHSHGIVHRDVKPENIMINTKNQIKVMDFGLAKLKGSLKLTKTRSTVGTLAYMAPEQIEGGEVDARSDIFSFGVVLFEMLSGRLPFRGEHEAAMMYSIMNEEPEPIQKYLPDVQSDIAYIINKALEKSPGERYQSVGEMLVDLHRAKKQSTKVIRPSHSDREVPHATGYSIPSGYNEIRPHRRVRKRLLFGGGLIVIFLAAGLIWLILRPASKSTIPLTVNADMTFRILDVPFTQIDRPGFSPDGNWVSFAAADSRGKWDLYFMNISGGEPRRITFDSTDFTGYSDLSPDGSWIVYDYFNYQIQKWELHMVSSLGGQSRTVATRACRARWSPDGERIGYLTGMGTYVPSKSGKLEIRSVKLDGSDDRLELMDSVSNSMFLSSWFDWSPQDRSIAWLRVAEVNQEDIMVRDLETGQERQLTFDKRDISAICWSKNNEIIFSSNKTGNFNLWLVPASGGSAVRLTRGAEGYGAQKISADGKRLICLQQHVISDISIANIDGSNVHRVASLQGTAWNPSFSPDGRQIIFAISDFEFLQEPSSSSIVLMDRNGDHRRKLMGGAGFLSQPKFSPDGAWIAYLSRAASEPPDSLRIFLIEASNPVSPKLIGKGREIRWVDAKRIAFFTGVKSLMTTVDGTDAKQIYEDSTYVLPILDGKYYYFRDYRTGKEGRYIINVAPDGSLLGKPKKVFSGEGGAVISLDGSFLTISRGDGQLVRISLPDGTMQRCPATKVGAISFDGRETAYIDTHINAKLVIMENFH